MDIGVKTAEFPVNPDKYTMSDGTDITTYDYRYESNFWRETHPMTKRLDVLTDLVNGSLSGREPCLDMIEMCSLMYHDLYNNGGGSKQYWDVQREMSAFIEAIFGKSDCQGHVTTNGRIRSAYYNLTNSVNDEWEPANVQATRFYMEVFMTEVVYAIGKHLELQQA